MSSPRLRDDPYKYTRYVKGRWQARYHDAIADRRIDLGTYPTREQALAAIRRYLKTGHGERPRFIRQRCVRGVTVFAATVTTSLGYFATQAEAHEAVERYIRRTEKKFRAELLLRRR